MSNDVRNAVGNAVTNAVTNVVRSAVLNGVPYPYPSSMVLSSVVSMADLVIIGTAVEGQASRR